MEPNSLICERLLTGWTMQDSYLNFLYMRLITRSSAALRATITAKSSWNTHAFLRFPGPFPFLCQQRECKPPPPVKQC